MMWMFSLVQNYFPTQTNTQMPFSPWVTINPSIFLLVIVFIFIFNFICINVWKSLKFGRDWGWRLICLAMCSFRRYDRVRVVCKIRHYAECSILHSIFAFLSQIYGSFSWIILFWRDGMEQKIVGFCSWYPHVIFNTSCNKASILQLPSSINQLHYLLMINIDSLEMLLENLWQSLLACWREALSMLKTLSATSSFPQSINAWAAMESLDGLEICVMPHRHRLSFSMWVTFVENGGFNALSE